MSKELFTKIINEAKELNIKNVGLYTTGEAFLHPQIFDFIKIKKNKGNTLINTAKARNKEEMNILLF